MKFEIDVRPMTENTFIRHSHRGTYISNKGREWREHIQWHIKNLINKGSLIPFKEGTRLEGKYAFHFKGKRKRDTANYEKPLTDCFEGFLFENDECIEKWTLERFYNAEYDHVIVEFNERK
tara:strand:+ start:245 stop:607 length:363 start_codon:yes stop_codon:yes gene_type:complete